jgi:hypothetical protein
MRRTLGLGVALVLAMSLVTTGNTASAAPTTRWVNDNDPNGFPYMPPGTSCNDPGYPDIQSAVNAAASGDRINVCPGTYTEEVLISGSAKNSISLRSVGVWQAIIKAPAVMLGPTKSIVRVSGAQGVQILAFTITGPGGSLCDSLRYGVRVDSGGSADILGNHITQIHDTPFGGCQNGVAVLVGRKSESTTGSARIIGNVIDNYQKNGPTVSNTGSYAEIAYNRITGVGPTALIAQNGIQASGGANANIRHNFVSGNIYTPQTFAASGVILFAPGVVVLDRNTVSSSDVGVFDLEAAPGTSITNNSVRASTFDGIDVDVATTNQRVEMNKVSQNSGPGIGLYDAKNNAIWSNWVDRNQDSGILLYAFPAGSNGNDVRGNAVTNNGSNPGGDTTDGIRINSPSTGNTIAKNRLKRNIDHDCHDWSLMSGNTWTDNEAQTSFPPTICREDEDADRGHDESDYGWDRNHNWNVEYGAPAEMDFTAAYATVNVDALLQLLPQLQLNTSGHLASPSD